MKHQPAPERLRERPIFQGQRLTVWAWMTRELQGMLGSGAEAFGFDLDEHAIDWLEEADARAMRVGVIPDLWRWLRRETLAEAVRRGLSLEAESSPVIVGYERQRAAQVRSRVYGGCPHDPKCAQYQACVDRIALELRSE